MISEGGADFILAFEKLEGLRLLPYLKAGGAMIINDQAIPLYLSWWERRSTGKIIDYIRSKVPATLVLDALGIATSAAI